MNNNSNSTAHITASIRKKLERNVRLWGYYKMFTKRVFIPVVTVYAADAAGLSIHQIGITTALASLASVLFDSTTGYWADIHGRKKSSQVGALFGMLASGLYVVWPSFVGISLAAISMAIGFSFMAGSMEALVHDSLVELGKEDDYAKVAARAQSKSLIANSLFVGLTPLLYPIDKRLPFVAGIAAYALLFYISSQLYEPDRPKSDTPKDPNVTETRRSIMTAAAKNFKAAANVFVSRYTILFFVCLGFALSITVSTQDVLNLSLRALGMPVRYVGFIFAASSLLAVPIGYVIHHLKRLSFRQYACFDTCTSVLLFAGFGFVRSLPLAIAVFSFNLALWRFQRIMYQHHLLQQYPRTKYKATLMSLINNFQTLNDFWIAIVATSLAGAFGLFKCSQIIMVVLIVFIPIYLLSIGRLQRHTKIQS